MAPHIPLRETECNDTNRALEPAFGQPSHGENFPEFVELEDWEFEETIRQAQRLLRSVTDDSSTGMGQRTAERTHSIRKQSLERPARAKPKPKAKAPVRKAARKTTR